jgi:DNA-binding LytR/AlgR family response regulator
MDHERTELCLALKRFFIKRGEDVDIVEYACGEALLADMEEFYERFELIFLDIYMAEMTGMETARKLRRLGVTSAIVFLTVTSEFAIDGYEIQAAGYLLKPLDEERLHRLLVRLLEPVERPRIAIRYKGSVRYHFIDEIMYVESNKHMVIFHFKNGETAQTNEKLNTLEQQLNSRKFLRCHQSYLVNMDYVADVQDVFVMKDGSRVPIRVRTRRAITNAYHGYFVAHAVESLAKEDVYV